MFFYSIEELEENKKKKKGVKNYIESKGLRERVQESMRKKYERESKCLERENIRSRNIGY